MPLAFVLSGPASKWKQPLGYFSSLGLIKSIILQSPTKGNIDRLDKTGLNGGGISL